MMPQVTIYADGSCGSDTSGGWAASLYWYDKSLHLAGNEEETTNNRMELTAVLKALESLNEPCLVQLYCDSQYVLNGVKGFIYRWNRHHWMTKSGTPVANKDIWKQLVPLVKKHKIKTHWVKGHAGHVNNETVDSLANFMRKLITH